jgi:hypothetical protein
MAKSVRSIEDMIENSADNFFGGVRIEKNGWRSGLKMLGQIDDLVKNYKTAIFANGFEKGVVNKFRTVLDSVEPTKEKFGNRLLLKIDRC